MLEADKEAGRYVKVVRINALQQTMRMSKAFLPAGWLEAEVVA